MLRRLLFWIILVAALLLATTHGSAVSQIVITARYESWQWLAAGIALQLVCFALRVLTYREAFAAVGVRRTWLDLAPVVLASVYLNTVVPGAGPTSPSLISREAVRRGYPVGASGEMTVVNQLARFVGLGIVMAGGFAYLVSLDAWRAWEVFSAVAVLGMVVVLSVGLALAVTSPRQMQLALSRIESTLSRVPGLGLGRAESVSDALTARYAGAGRAIASHPLGLVSALVASVATYVFDLATFVALGFALGWPALGALVAAYAAGTLVWLLSPIPQGMGVVEAVFALMLASFGADAPTAIAISLAFRALTFWLPLVAGWVLVSRVGALSSLAAEAHEVFPVRLAAVATFIVGAANVLTAVTPRMAARLQPLHNALPLQSQYGRLSAALAGVALMMLARGLWRRKRLAWLVTVAVLVASIAGPLVRGRGFGVAAAAAVLLAFLLIRQREFRARSDVPSIAQGLRVLAAAVAFTVAYGTLGFFLLDRQYSVNFTFWPAVRQTFVMFTLFYDPSLHPVTRLGEFFVASIYVVGAATLGYALVMLLRPVLPGGPASAADARRAAEIVSRFGRTPLAKLALLADKSYFFSEGGAVIAYRTVGAIALALGDPVGPERGVASAIPQFAQMSATNDWSPAFYQTLPDHLDEYRAAGFSVAKIGHDAVVDVRAFSLSGKRYSVERNLMNRLANEGYRTVMYPAPLSAALLAGLRDVSDAWLAREGGSEMGFSLGWFDDDYLRQSAVMTVEGPSGEIEAFANVIVAAADMEAAVDLMRYRPSALDGVMDFMFIRLIEWARESGFQGLNLGFSALSGVGEQEDPAVERAMRLVYEYGNRFYSFKGLYRFKQKFRPEWQPRFLVYRDASELPAVLTALVRANSGEPDLAEQVKEWAGTLRPARS